MIGYSEHEKPCILACAAEHCPWRCPVLLADSVTDVVFDLLIGDVSSVAS